MVLILRLTEMEAKAWERVASGCGESLKDCIIYELCDGELWSEITDYIVEVKDGHQRDTD